MKDDSTRPVKHNAINFVLNTVEQTPGEDLGRRAGVLFGRALRKGRDLLDNIANKGTTQYHEITEEIDREKNIGGYTMLVNHVLGTDWNYPATQRSTEDDLTIIVEATEQRKNYSLERRTKEGTENAQITFNGAITKEEAQRILETYGNILLLDKKTTAKAVEREDSFDIENIGTAQHKLNYTTNAIYSEATLTEKEQGFLARIAKKTTPKSFMIRYQAKTYTTPTIAPNTPQDTGVDNATANNPITDMPIAQDVEPITQSVDERTEESS